MLKLLPLILENEVDQEVDLGKSHVISETAYNFLRAKVDELNKKANKWGVPPMELKVLKEEFKKVYVWKDENVEQVTTSQPPIYTKFFHEVTVKQYEIQIIGEPPTVEGYEFIAKVEHTPEGNMLNYAPKASDQHLPPEYRTARQACDVCKTTRDRNNTFILKLEKDDPQRFPEKRKGDLIMVGSSCLKRFLPNPNSANSLMEYAEMIEAIRAAIHQAGEMEDDFSGEGGAGGQGNWLSQDQMGLWLSAVYIHTGKYMSKKKAAEFETSSTVEQAFSAMNARETDKKENEIHQRMRTDEAFKQKAEAMAKEFIEWAKTKDFDSLINQKPDFADFFHNLKVLSKQENFKANNAGFFGALFATFLRDKGELEKKAALKKSSADFTYFGQPGGKIKVKARVNKIKEYASQWGQSLIVTMEADGVEKDANGQDVAKKGNLLYFTSKFELEEGEEAEIEATVKSHQPNKYTSIPETVITRAKITNFITHPEKNGGKSKIKDLNGIVDITNVYEQMDWNTQQKRYGMNFRYNTTHHPDMKKTGDYWGIEFTYYIPDEATYQSLKQYEKKMVEAKWSLDRAITLDKLKSNNLQNNVSKFSVIKVLGDIPNNQG